MRQIHKKTSFFLAMTEHMCYYNKKNTCSKMRARIIFRKFNDNDVEGM